MTMHIYRAAMVLLTIMDEAELNESTMLEDLVDIEDWKDRFKLTESQSIALILDAKKILEDKKWKETKSNTI